LWVQIARMTDRNPGERAAGSLAGCAGVPECGLALTLVGQFALVAIGQVYEYPASRGRKPAPSWRKLGRGLE